jgi:hypothetical protein
LTHLTLAIFLLKEICALKKSAMGNRLLLQNRLSSIAILPAPVISISGNTIKPKTELKPIKTAKKTPLFYTEPIFRCKKNDPL